MRQKFTDAFKAETAKEAIRFIENGGSISEFAKTRDIRPLNISRWIRKYEQGEYSDPSESIAVPKDLVKTVAEEFNREPPTGESGKHYLETRQWVRSIEIHHNDTMPFEVHLKKVVEPDGENGRNHENLELVIAKNGEQLVFSDQNSNEPADLLSALSQLLNQSTPGVL